MNMRFNIILIERAIFEIRTIKLSLAGNEKLFPSSFEYHWRYSNIRRKKLYKNAINCFRYLKMIIGLESGIHFNKASENALVAPKINELQKKTLDSDADKSRATISDSAVVQ